MLLSDLLTAILHRRHGSEADVQIAGITDDSRAVAPGFLFVAVPGTLVDGHAYLDQALSKGAVAIVGEREAADLSLPDTIPYIRVQDTRAVLGWLHAAWWGFPSRRVTLIGVTGTDGKTTTTNLIYAMLSAAGNKTGMISTVNARIGERSVDTGLHTTTPSSGEIQAYLAEMVAAGATHVVLESTSHGLAQHRLAGCEFDVAVVTNITHEHLDYHGTFTAYREAKAMLFQGLMRAQRKPNVLKIAILNADDAGSYDYLRQIASDWQVVYGLDETEADVTAGDVCYSPEGISFMLLSPWCHVPIQSRLVGAFNVHNILAAASASLALGVSPEAVRTGVMSVSGVPGRMERIDLGQSFTAIVDFAHTPNALRRALETARGMVNPAGRVITVFGCAGLRDREKRRMMGEVAAELADLTVITAEDPRTESLDAIMAETAAALEGRGRREGIDFWRVADRGAALLHAVSLAKPGDLVITCGKGHEQSMCFGTQEYPWDDREALRLAILGKTLDNLPTAVKHLEP